MKLQNNSNNKIKAHPILAGIIDFYLINVLILTIISTLHTMLQKNFFSESLYTFSFAILLMTIVGVIVYYKVLARKVKFLSFGEYMTGRRFEGGEKYWSNPYNCNRFGIFMIIIINVILLGNEWDRGTSGYIYNFTELLGKLTRIGIITYALKLLSERKLNGIVILICLSIISGIGFQFQEMYPQIRTFGLYMNLGLAAVYTVVYFIYRNILANQSIE